MVYLKVRPLLSSRRLDNRYTITEATVIITDNLMRISRATVFQIMNELDQGNLGRKTKMSE